MTLEDIERLSRLPPPQDPRVFGRDASNPYYDLLYRLVEEARPRLVVELGTCTGAGTAHLAEPDAGQTVVSVDLRVDKGLRERLAASQNAFLWEMDTRDPALLRRLQAMGPVDLLFVDTLHTYEQASFELRAYGPLVREGGVILFDDVKMDEGMRRFWSEVPEPKTELPHLHWTGFGASMVCPQAMRQ